MTLFKQDALVDYNFWGEFADTKLEHLFIERKRLAIMKRIQLVTLCCVFVYFGFIFYDYMLMGRGPIWDVLSLCRSLVLLLGIGSFAMSFKKSYAVFLPYSMSGLIISIGIAEAMALYFDFDPAKTIGLPFFVLGVLIFYLFLSTRTRPIVYGSLISAGCYNYVMCFYTEASWRYSLSIMFCLLLVNAVGFYFLRAFGCAQRKEFMMMWQERMLNVRLLKEFENKTHTEEDLIRWATIDELTKIPNRRYFKEVATHMWKVAKQYGLSSSMVFIDIDRFKWVNDLYGHATGDMVLQQISALLRKNIRRQDVLGRLGGDEFVIFLINTDANSAMTVAERLRKIVEAHQIDASGQKISVTVSMGVALCTEEEENLDLVIKKADRAMYEAKKKGRNYSCMAFDEAI